MSRLCLQRCCPIGPTFVTVLSVENMATALLQAGQMALHIDHIEWGKRTWQSQGSYNTHPLLSGVPLFHGLQNILSLFYAMSHRPMERQNIYTLSCLVSHWPIDFKIYTHSLMPCPIGPWTAKYTLTVLCNVPLAHGQSKYTHTLLSCVPTSHLLQNIHSLSYAMSNWPMDRQNIHTLSCLVSHCPMDRKIYSNYLTPC
jgi:hypothetical protein